MRTRLDEIVEEELSATAWNRDGRIVECKRIAERAFRHGVEQCSERMFRPDFFKENVQPAPAEEKCADCGHSRHEGWGCAICGSRSVKPFCVDRRKGERRKGLEWIRRHQYHVAYGETGVNRRSGKDRRKP